MKSSSNFKINNNNLNYISVLGPYSYLEDPENVYEGKNFTQKQKQKIIEENMKKNCGKVKSDLSCKELVKPQKSKKGITPSQNEWQIDHIRSKQKWWYK